MTLYHPVSGEVLPDNDVRKLREAYDDAWPVWRAASRLRERIAELEGEYGMPPARRQSDKQRRIAACPRCGHKEAA